MPFLVKSWWPLHSPPFDSILWKLAKYQYIILYVLVEQLGWIFLLRVESVLRPENDSGRAAAAAAKSLQSCPTLCDPIDSSPPGSPVSRILWAKTPEWVAISFSSAWKWKVKVKSLSCVWLFATPWTAAYQPPPPMGFSRVGYWSGVQLSSPSGRVITFKMSFPQSIVIVNLATAILVA